MEETRKSGAAKTDAGQSFMKGVRKEFARITWPTRQEVFKQTVAVVVISVLAGVFISLLDMGFSAVINALAGIG